MGRRQQISKRGRVRAAAALERLVEAHVGQGRLFAKKADVGQYMGFADNSAVSHHTSGRRPFDRATTLRYAEAFGVDPWSIANDEVRAELTDDERRSGRPDDQIVVPFVGRAAAGPGSVDDAPSLPPPQIPRSWCERERVNSLALRTIEIHGTSMRGTIEDGDFAIVRTDRTDVRSHSGVYALALDGVNVAKRLTHGGNGIIVASDDGITPPFFASAADIEAGSLTVLGLIWLKIGRVT